MQLFYAQDLISEDNFYQFSKEESRHLVKVLRHSEGDEIEITNGNGWLFKSRITSADPKRCRVEILSSALIEKHPYSLHLAVAPTKMNDRFEWFVEKATEIGVDEITPLICEHSERRIIKKDRLLKTALSALKQSNGYYLPKINDQVQFSDFIEKTETDSKFIAHCLEDQKFSLKNRIIPKSKVLILIGPEGDFSVKEIETALAKNFIPVTLGNKRLRTETAAISACVTVALINE